MTPITNNSTLKISLTGGIASGKSQVTRLFSQLGIDIIDADKIARALFAPKAVLLKDLRHQFGDGIFFDSGELNRGALGKIVFNNKAALKWLNELTHPLVADKISQQLTQVQSDYVILDIPLLINQQGIIPTHLKAVTDRVLVVDVCPEIQIQRLCKRDNITQEQALSIINNQSTRQQKLALADDIIDNNTDFSTLERQVNELHRVYLSLASQSKSRN
ncbi:dephospho-CoA kinase [Aliikangiella maris]|uniref:Dephospho-CoA kinase n=2 Tax=Aliikangiella maris TaxID=3162458 RepID=A0ABV3MMM3_9GAMM